MKSAIITTFQRAFYSGLFSSLLLFAQRSDAATALELAQAMDIPTNTVTSATFTTLANSLAVSVSTDWGTNLPRAGASFAVMSTGRAVDQNSPGFVVPEPGSSFGTSTASPVAGQTTAGSNCVDSIPESATANDLTELRLTLVAPTNANAFALSYRLFTAEYPESVCGQYNDYFLVLLSSQGSTATNVALDSRGLPLSVRTVAYTVTNSAELAGTGMQNGVGGGTDWIRKITPVEPGSTNVLRFIIFDSGDSSIDTLAIIDNFQWLNRNPVVQINRAVEIRWGSVSNEVYQVQWAPVLASNSWSNLGAPVVGNGTTNSVCDSATAGSRYYRVIVP